LSRKVVDFVWLSLLDASDKAWAICHISMMEKKTNIFFVTILIQMVNPVGVEERRATLNTVDDITFVEQKFRKVCAILACHARNEGNFGLIYHEIFKGMVSLLDKYGDVIDPTNLDLARYRHAVSRSASAPYVYISKFD
jgi:hypothetical protein